VTRGGVGTGREGVITAGGMGGGAGGGGFGSSRRGGSPSRRRRNSSSQLDRAGRAVGSPGAVVRRWAGGWSPGSISSGHRSGSSGSARRLSQLDAANSSINMMMVNRPSMPNQSVRITGHVKVRAGRRMESSELPTRCTAQVPDGLPPPPLEGPVPPMLSRMEVSATMFFIR
jgi:hypothetical protein